MQKFRFYSSAIFLASIMLCAVACQQTQPKQVASMPTVIHDTIVVHDTVKISDESDIESIKYYKTLSERLWRGIELIQKNTPESDAELAELNRQIVSAREKHNQSVNEAMIADIKRVMSAK